VRICIPLADGPGGGAYSFFRNLRAYCARAGIAVTGDVDAGADLVFANAWTIPASTIARAKRHPATRVLHRIDGSAVDYGRDELSDVRQALVNLLADATVFQSAYGRQATRGRGVIGQDGPVIHNPVDVERFRPEGERAPLPGRVRLAHVTYSTNPRKGADAVYGLARTHPGVTFVLAGRYEAVPGLANVVDLGYTDWTRLPAVLRACDALLFLSENETCPNVVIEALASGLPVLYRRSGGTPELVADCGVAVDDGFDVALEAVLDRRADLARAARRRALECFAFEAVFPRYLDAGAAATRRPLPGVRARVAALRRLRPRMATVGRWMAADVARPLIAGSRALLG
jgi:glycosyltransferase involved in cell wall biosynthesis